MNDPAQIQRKKRGIDHKRASQLIHSTLNTGGQPLDNATRAFIEPRFGHDFSKVRVHSDAGAAASAATLNARAYTVGSSIVFDEGQYAPETTEGKHLLAHELTHILQQSRTTTISEESNLEVSRPGDTSELEADRISEQIMSGDPNLATRVSSVAHQPASVQRWFGNGEDLKDDFWGAKYFLGNKWGGVGDAAISAAWNLGGAIPEFGTAEGLVGAGIDGLKWLTASEIAAYHSYTGSLSAADADLEAAKRFGHDMELSAASAIPIWGTGQGVVTGLWDAASAIDRATGGIPAPLSGDIWDEVSPL